MIVNLEACRKYYEDQKTGKFIPNIYSRFGDIAQISEDVYVNCNRNLLGL